MSFVGSLTWGEAGGALGDLGTFVPLLVGLAVHNGMDVGTTLLFTGFYNIFTGMLTGPFLGLNQSYAC